MLLRLLAPSIIWDPPSLLYTVLTQPVKTLVRLLDLVLNLLRPRSKPGTPAIRVVCISDTHCLKTTNIPDGDLLIHAGDLTNLGNVSEIQAQIDWLNSLPHEHKVVIAGNHDRHLDPRSREALPLEERYDVINWRSLWYLQHSAVTLKFAGGRQLKVYGAPQTPTAQLDDHGFRYIESSDAWTDTIPPDVDVLITHTPPKFHMDLPAALGCEHLLREVWEIQPTLHVFGHIHAGKSDFVGGFKAGQETVRWDDGQRVYENALRRKDGFIRGILDPRSWFDAVQIVFYGISNVLWEQVWGGSSPPTTTMVLASLMYCNTGRLGNPPITVDI
jgi:Icc-related predicted phosphoesterase